jgi:hypothetical protein
MRAGALLAARWPPAALALLLGLARLLLGLAWAARGASLALG